MAGSCWDIRENHTVSNIEWEASAQLYDTLSCVDCIRVEYKANSKRSLNFHKQCFVYVAESVLDRGSPSTMSWIPKNSRENQTLWAHSFRYPPTYPTDDSRGTRSRSEH